LVAEAGLFVSGNFDEPEANHSFQAFGDRLAIAPQPVVDLINRPRAFRRLLQKQQNLQFLDGIDVGANEIGNWNWKLSWQCV
jgi:hypothetical protein